MRKRKEVMKSEKKEAKKREKNGREINVIRASDNNAKFVACIQIIYS